MSSVRHLHRLTESIRFKLDVRNDLQMAIVADRLGLVSDESVPGEVGLSPRQPFGLLPK